MYGSNVRKAIASHAQLIITSQASQAETLSIMKWSTECGNVESRRLVLNAQASPYGPWQQVRMLRITLEFVIGTKVVLA